MQNLFRYYLYLKYSYIKKINHRRFDQNYTSIINKFTVFIIKYNSILITQYDNNVFIIQ